MLCPLASHTRTQLAALPLSALPHLTTQAGPGASTAVGSLHQPHLTSAAEAVGLLAPPAQEPETAQQWPWLQDARNQTRRQSAWPLLERGDSGQFCCCPEASAHAISYCRRLKPTWKLCWTVPAMRGADMDTKHKALYKVDVPWPSCTLPVTNRPDHTCGTGNVTHEGVMIRNLHPKGWTQQPPLPYRWELGHSQRDLLLPAPAGCHGAGGRRWPGTTPTWGETQQVHLPCASEALVPDTFGLYTQQLIINQLIVQATVGLTLAPRAWAPEPALEEGQRLSKQQCPHKLCPRVPPASTGRWKGSKERHTWAQSPFPGQADKDSTLAVLAGRGSPGQGPAWGRSALLAEGSACRYLCRA